MEPCANLPFDPLATRTAQKLGLQVKFVCGSNLNEVRNVIRGKKHVGTLISE